MNDTRIAVVGIALRYPDASSPDELWRNVLAGRRAFRRLPPERMRAEDYYSPDLAAPDRHYTRMAAVLEGFEFDRVKYRIGGSTFRSTDMTHWLALDTATRALEDAGFPGGTGLPKATTGAIIGNTLTGEFSRANLMRLRWPFVRRTVGAALRERGWNEPEAGLFLDDLEQRYKSPFPPINEDTLAGGLANTISGRICNYYDLGGGGFTVDGACSSSLLSTAIACEALASGQLDVAITGGVDLSIDPFEVIGFAKTGALSTGEMKVYDRDSNGFWPGEGCGMLVLMRNGDATRLGKRRYATIAGWGYSSDGKGGITRPEVLGHRLAIQRAYERAGFGFESVSYVEGHGTGTEVGDATELTAFCEARRAAGPDAPPLAIGTIKGNFGHTKAAAGVAGLIKAVLVVRHQIIPPASSHYVDHPVLSVERPAIRIPGRAEPWPDGVPVRAAVSSMGFGGINAHVVVEHADGVRRTGIGEVTRKLVRSRQDAELLLLDAPGLAGLRAKAARLAGLAGKLSFAELGDAASTLAGSLGDGPVRAAIVARTPEEAEQRSRKLLDMLGNGARSVLDPAGGVFLGTAATPPQITYLFPGQGSGRRGDGGAIRRRFADIDALYERLRLPAGGDQVATAVAQPRIVTGSVAALRVLSSLGIEAAFAVGHSLGELTALHWAGMMTEETLLAAAAARGEIMSRASAGGGAMAGIAAPPPDIEPLLAGEPAVIAGYNSPVQTVISGPEDAVERVCAAASARGLTATRLSVSHAFHSPAVAPASRAFREYLEGLEFTPAVRTMISTVTGGKLPPRTDVSELLGRQVLEPVRFAGAVSAVADQTDLFLEAGPGHALCGLASETAPGVPALSVEADSESLYPLLCAVAAAYALGAPVRAGELFRDRYVKCLPLDKEFLFLASPCESAPEDGAAIGGAGPASDVAPPAAAAASPEPAESAGTAGQRGNSLDILRRLMAERAELPLEAVQGHTNPLDELHLSSITVIQVVSQAAQEVGREPTLSSAAFATSTVAQLAQIIDELDEAGGAGDARPAIAGVAPWVRAFAVDHVPAGAGRPAGPVGEGEWQVFSSPGHPLAAPLAESLRQARLGAGVLLCLPQEAAQDDLPQMLDAARAALSQSGDARFAVTGGRKGAAGLAKTLHLEAPNVATTVVILPDGPMPGHVGIVQQITADVAATSGFSEVHYDAAGVRSVPVLSARPRAGVDGSRRAQAAQQVLGDADVVLVTGGGKGITAECARELGRCTGARIAILGRSDPAADPELAANLQRLRRAGVTFRYLQADVTSPDEVRAAVSEIRQTLGSVTAVLHGAGRNEPRSLATLDETAFRRTLAPKIGGLEAVLDAVDAGAIKLLVAFGSIIGRAGLSGEADYATANDWLADLTRRTQARLPGCRCLTLEWSVWAGAGMGERLGVLDALVRDGITPIPVEEGVGIFLELVNDPGAVGSLVVMGRAGSLPTMTLKQPQLPLTRFIERPQIHYPGIELVVDADLSVLTDPYLSDHYLDGDLLFPAVVGMEAMAQVSAALTGRADTPVLENVEFLRPIVVPPEGKTTIRVAALADTPETADVVIRSADTGFRADHFRARLRFASGPLPGPHLPPLDAAAADGSAPRVPVDPASELYGPVLFQGGRFRRLLGYRQLAARGCVAEISNVAGPVWFGDFMPPDLTLADPGTRDALMHSIQPCVPDATLLPVGIEALRLADPVRARDLSQVLLHARERSRVNDTYVYDLDVYELGGGLLEQWRGLRLQAVRKLDGTGPWLPVLLGPYLERNVEPALGTGIRVAVSPAGSGVGAALLQRERGALALSGPSWRPGGAGDSPYDAVPGDGPVIIASDAAGISFAVASERPVSGAVELAGPQPEEELAALVGSEGFALARRLASARGESLPVAVARVYGAMESARRSGQAPATVTEAAGTWPDQWAVLRSGGATIASFATTLQSVIHPVVFTILAGEAA